MSNLEDKPEVGPELPEVDTQDPLPPREGKVDNLRHRVMTAAAAAPGIEDTLKTVVVEAEPVVAHDPDFRYRSRFFVQVGEGCINCIRLPAMATDQIANFCPFSDWLKKSEISNQLEN